MSDNSALQQEAAANTPALDEQNPNNEPDTKPTNNADDAEDDDEILGSLYEKKADIELTEKAWNKLVGKKRKAYAEAKKYREENDALKEQLAKYSQESGMSDETLKKLQDELASREELLKDYESRLKAVNAEKAKMQLDYAMQKHSVSDTEYVEFMLHKHMQSLNDPEQLKAFNVDEWMSSLKSSKPHAFGSQGSGYANSGLPPQPAGSGMPAQSGKRGAEDPKQLDNEWLEWKRKNGL